MSYNDDERGFAMDKKDEKQGKKCFIITPIGSENSDIFRKAKGVIESTIKPVLREYGFIDIKPAYEINVSGMINTQIINRIINDDLVIANLTGNNPNVMYELCLRHVVAKPIIHICENGTQLPFDIKDNRTIFYENDMLGAEELKYKLRDFMDNISYANECMDNPIYIARKYDVLLKKTQGTETNELLKMLINISNEIAELKNTNEESKSSINNWRYEKIYSFDSFTNDISRVNKNDAIKYLENAGEKVKVFEIANNLGLSSRSIAIIAELVGVNIKSIDSTVNKMDLNRIIGYIINNQV